MYAFALVVCRDAQGRFLLVHETRGRGWWLPAGRVEAGERFEDAALRETREESGIEATLEGVLRVEWSNGPEAARLRVVFLARATGGALKREPDEHSEEARWVRPEELGEFALRGAEPARWFAYVAAGGAVAPLAVLGPEDEGPRL